MAPASPTTVAGFGNTDERSSQIRDCIDLQKQDGKWCQGFSCLQSPVLAVLWSCSAPVNDCRITSEIRVRPQELDDCKWIEGIRLKENSTFTLFPSCWLWKHFTQQFHHRDQWTWWHDPTDPQLNCLSKPVGSEREREHTLNENLFWFRFNGAFPQVQQTYLFLSY